MNLHHGLTGLALAAIFTATAPNLATAQQTGTIRGEVKFTSHGGPVHGAVVLVVEPSLVTLTDEDGAFEFLGVPAGTHEILSQREHLSAGRKTVNVTAGETVTIDFNLDLTTVHEELTVTATAGGQATAFEAFNAITTLDSFELVGNPTPTLGEALENEPGVSKRSFGPGSSRPIIRGFDGDRVLIMEDGIRTGDLSGQSADHGITLDPNGLDRVEIVRGPATLLYGSNAVGGVVNAITPHDSYLDALVQGTRGQASIDFGSAASQKGTNGSIRRTTGNMVFWLAGGTRGTDDYDTPIGTIENSSTELHTGRAGLGYFGDKFFASAGMTAENSMFGVPFADAFHGHEEEEDHHDEEDIAIDLNSRRRVGRFDLGLRNLENPLVDSVRVVANVVDWHHDEIETEEGNKFLGTAFDNRTYVVRAEANQRQTGLLAGKFGVWAQVRDYAAVGEEALAPATDQRTVALFAYEELDFGRVRMQLGGRVERNSYSVAAREPGEAAEEVPFAPSGVRDRNFAGASLSGGLQVGLGPDTALVANVTRSHRAPALEELYNFGPHVGNLLFEVGNPDLEREATVGVDLSLRHQTATTKASINGYVYDIDNFVFASVTDSVVGPLRVAEFLQADGRFVGMDGEASVLVEDRLWVNAGFGLVDARLTATDEALPRIPPLKGRVSVDIPYQGLTISPEVILAADQRRVSRDETTTDGYSVFNLKASYVWAGQHESHMITLSGYNLTNELYRNHTSFIKDLAPELGRGFRVGYSVRFF
jgi:iron complex outermembrane receptor protein